MNDLKIALLGVLLLLAMLLGASWGAIDVPVLSIPRILIDRSPDLEFQILWNIRLPRVLTGALVGMCLAVAGTIMQCVLRNPLAAPNIIGVSSGAGFVGYGLLILFPSYAHLLPLGAFAGALGTALLGFVGLIVPHMVRLWVGPDHRRLVPASALGGAALVTLADLAGRLVLDPMEIPVGIPMALLGGPFFLYLLRTRSV